MDFQFVLGTRGGRRAGSHCTTNFSYFYIFFSPFSEQNKTDRINSDSSTSVSSGVISLSTSRKTSGKFDEPVVIILQSNKVRHRKTVSLLFSTFIVAN